MGFDAQEVHAEYQSLTPHQRAYLGNVGEFRGIGNWIGDGQKEPDPAYCFITTVEASDHWKDKGSVGRLSTGSIGQTTDASGITHENSMVALSLKTGRAELRRPMTWLGDLSGYSIAADQINGKLILAVRRSGRAP